MVTVVVSVEAYRRGQRKIVVDTSSDPYAIEGFDRALVKAWTLATMGNAGHLKRWPKGLSQDYEKKHGKRPAAIATVSEIRERMVAKHPGLANWDEQRFTWADLMFQESEAVMGAMSTLMEKDLPSYAVHDSLIVREKDEAVARDVLQENYKQAFGVAPNLTVNRPGRVVP